MRQDGEGPAERGPPPCGTGLVGEQAGEGLPQVADGFGFGLILTWGPALGCVGRAEAVCQGLGFVEMGVGWCWLLGLFTLLRGAAALHRGPGL